LLVVAPSGAVKWAPPPVDGRVAWPPAQRAALAATLDDGTAYQPAVFLDAQRSIGTAPTRDGRTLRFLLRAADGKVRVLRTLPMRLNPSFESPATDGQWLVWAESSKSGQQLWAADLRDGKAPRRLTAAIGDARFYQSQYDLVIAEGRVHWVAAAGDTTEVRSVALAGGPVDVRTEAGTWALSAWPWLTDGVTAAGGTTRLRNLSTGQDRAVATSGRGVTACSPAWCRTVAFNRDGYPQITLMRPDGSDRRVIAAGTAATVIADTAVLDRFEVFSQITANSELTGHVELLAYEIDTRSTVEISPDATDVTYRSGVLWWSTGSQDEFVRHSLDLRTV
jgi:hypothetical protein